MRTFQTFAARANWAGLSGGSAQEAVAADLRTMIDVVDIFPSEVSNMHLIGLVLFEQNYEWGTATR